MSLQLDVGLIDETWPSRFPPEQFGFGGAWIADSQSTFREAFTLLGACSAATDRILLTTGVTNPVTRSLPVLASAFATLEELAPGRTVLAIGKGDTAVRTIGLTPPPLGEFESAIEELRRLLAGGDDAFQWGPCPVQV